MKKVVACCSVAVLLAMMLAACAPGSPAAPAPAPAAPAAKPAARSAPQSGTQSAPRGADFSGKTITALVNFSAGGPTDIFARMVVEHLKKHVPGRPTIVVENRPGAGGVIGANYLYNAARKDGLTIGMFSAPFSFQVLEAEGLQYDSAGFLWLAGVNESQVTYVHSSLGVKTPRELLTTPNEIVMGGLAPDSSKDLRMRAFLNALGVKYRYVTGFPGVADITMAVRRGEVNLADDSLTSYVSSIIPMVREGQAVPIAQQGIIKGGQLIRDPRVADVPTYLEVALDLKGDAVRQTVDWRAVQLNIEIGTMLRAIVYPPGTPPEAVEAMRKAMEDTFADPEFQAQSEKQLGYQFEFVPGAEAQELAERIIRLSREDLEALDYVRRMARERR